MIKKLRYLIRKFYIWGLKKKLHLTKNITFLPGSDISRSNTYGDSCIIAGKVVNCNLEGGNVVYGNMNDSTLGYGSFVAPYSSLEFTEVGRYTSIGRHVYIIRGQHPTSGFVSTSPVFYSTEKQTGFTYTKKQLFADYKFWDDNTKTAVHIGSDVWIGSGVIILEGVYIGDGAVIAAGSVVVKDVEPYAIVGGNPAKLIRYRHSEIEREKLLKIRWWEKDKVWIRNHASDFVDVKNFVEKYGEK